MTRSKAPDDATRVNHRWWNERAAFHRQTPLYQKHIQRLREGGLALLPLETSELGDISGLRALHMQCHIGTDTLSLARLGADVTGMDFSEVAIAEARKLSADLEIPAQFIQCRVAELAHTIPEQFDLVFTSHGVLSWLPDLTSWAQQAAARIKPGGRFYLSDSHPLVWAFAEEGAIEDDGVRLGLPWLSRNDGHTFVDSGSYADRHRETQHNETREWSWGLGDVLNALVSAGLTIEWLREHPVGFCQVTPEFRECEDGHFRLPEPLHGRYPLTFTVSARKP